MLANPLHPRLPQICLIGDDDVAVQVAEVCVVSVRNALPAARRRIPSIPVAFASDVQVQKPIVSQVLGALPARTWLRRAVPPRGHRSPSPYGANVIWTATRHPGGRRRPRCGSDG